MNRIKIKLARKKREKEEAAKKKAMGKDKITSRVGVSHHTKGGNTSKPSNASSLKAKVSIGAKPVSTGATTGTVSPTPISKAAGSFKKATGTLKITTLVTTVTEASKGPSPLGLVKSDKSVLN